MSDTKREWSLFNTMTGWRVSLAPLHESSGEVRVIEKSAYTEALRERDELDEHFQRVVHNLTLERDRLRAEVAVANDRRRADGICTRCNLRKNGGPTHLCPDGKMEHYGMPTYSHGPDIDGDAEILLKP